MEAITTNAGETQNLGQKIGSSLKGGETLALVGDLGSGKTTFIQGLASAFGINKVISPTFILMRTYPVAVTKGSVTDLFHLDLYRLERNVIQEVKNLGIEDIWGRQQNVVVIEWADKIKDILPKNTRWINFEYIDEQERKINY